MKFVNGKLVKNPNFIVEKISMPAKTVDIMPGIAIKGSGNNTPAIDQMSVRQMKISPVPITNMQRNILQNSPEYKKDKILELMNEALNFTGAGLKKINRIH